MNVFLAVRQPSKTIYIKVPNESSTGKGTKRIIGVHERLVDFIIDKGYPFYKIAPNKWDYNIETGLSYEIDTHQELNVFVKNNIKATKIRTHAI